MSNSARHTTRDDSRRQNSSIGSGDVDREFTKVTENHPQMDNAESEMSMNAPAAPTKVRRRRRPIFEKLRSKRQQILLQHSNGRSANEDASDVNGNFSGIASKTKRSLVAQYYCVDTVPSSPYISDGILDVVPMDGTFGSSDTRSDENNATRLRRTFPAISALESTSLYKSLKNGKSPSKDGQVVNVVLPGVPSYEEDWARDTHDYFNLIVLVPVTVLNIMNWNWDILLSALSSSFYGESHRNHHTNFLSYLEEVVYTVQSAWTGDWFDVFFFVTAAYFIFDLLWIVVLPVCVKSPSVIIQHHVAVLIYILIPYLHPNVRYCMGACMTVEINTWFLIARRVFNKQGFPPWTLIELNSWLSIRVKVISIFFYLTWICIRCLLYPVLLIPFYQHWYAYTKVTGTPFNILLLSIPLHGAFCLLNLKWSYELLMSKLRYFRRQRIFHKQHRRAAALANGRIPTNAMRPSNYPDPSYSDGL